MRTEDRPSPFVTIVVAIRNVAGELKDSLDTFSRQTRRDFEVLIADCNSTDDPAQHFAGRDYPITHVVQSDTGIYDAWNKVLSQARGEWLIFMGAGDTFAAADMLENISRALISLPETVIISYGRVNVVGENGQILQQCGAPWPEARAALGRLEMYPHQATFQRRRSFDLYGPFDTGFRIAGDVEMVLRVARQAEPVFVELVVANFGFGGTSSTARNRLAAVRERIRALEGSGIPGRYHKVLAKALILDQVQRLLPESILHRVIDLYRVATGRRARYRG